MRVTLYRSSGNLQVNNSGIQKKARWNQIPSRSLFRIHRDVILGSYSKSSTGWLPAKNDQTGIHLLGHTQIIEPSAGQKLALPLSRSKLAGLPGLSSSCLIIATCSRTHGPEIQDILHVEQSGRLAGNKYSRPERSHGKVHPALSTMCDFHTFAFSGKQNGMFTHYISAP